MIRARRMAITPQECALAFAVEWEREARTVTFYSEMPGWILVMLARLFPMSKRMAAITERHELETQAVHLVFMWWLHGLWEVHGARHLARRLGMEFLRYGSRNRIR